MFNPILLCNSFIFRGPLHPPWFMGFMGTAYSSLRWRWVLDPRVDPPNGLLGAGKKLEVLRIWTHTLKKCSMYGIFANIYHHKIWQTYTYTYNYIYIYKWYSIHIYIYIYTYIYIYIYISEYVQYMEHLQSLTEQWDPPDEHFHPEVSSSERLQDPSEGQDEFEDDHVEGDGAGEVTTCHDWISKFGGLQIYSKGDLG